MKTKANIQTLLGLEARGFDKCRLNRWNVSVSCSQCQALVINGLACHEAGCPNETYECNGCNAVVVAVSAF